MGTNREILDTILMMMEFKLCGSKKKFTKAIKRWDSENKTLVVADKDNVKAWFKYEIDEMNSPTKIVFNTNIDGTVEETVLNKLEFDTMNNIYIFFLR